MRSQQVKSLIFFFLILGIVFYVANLLVRVPGTIIEEDESRSQVFLSLVERLEAVDFDLDFIDAFSQDLFISRSPNVQRIAPVVGRANPFTDSGQSAPFPSPQEVIGFDERDTVLGEEDEIIIIEEDPFEDVPVPDEDALQDEVFSESIEDGGVLQFDS